MKSLYTPTLYPITLTFTKRFLLGALKGCKVREVIPCVDVAQAHRLMRGMLAGNTPRRLWRVSQGYTVTAS